MQKSLGGRLIFLDETWTTTAMTRRYAWADVGARAFGHAPNGHWKTTTFLAGLTCEGLIAPFVLDGPFPVGRSRSTRKQRLRPETLSASALRVTIVAAYCFCLVRTSVRKSARSARYTMSDPGNRRARVAARN